MNYKKSLSKLFSLHQFGIKLGLDNINNLLHHIDNPERKFKAIHIAGSNGKGSTASFIASILTEAGYNVGLYTSPHFIKYNERIRINGSEIPDDYVVGFINENNKYIDENSPTFFELTTALAFQYFAENKVDYAVIETGLGGRLDATNVLESIASVITSISYEHTNILGTTLESIATEKVAIIKRNQKVFIGILPEVARNVILDKTKKERAKLYELTSLAQIFDDKSIVQFRNMEITISNLPLLGEYQIRNATLAVLTITNLFPNTTVKSLLNGLKRVVENSGIQGRYEVYNEKPKVIFDSAHNSEGIKLFLNQFSKEKSRYTKRSLIYGAMRDKNVIDIITDLSKYFDTIYGTEIEYERSLKISELIKIGRKCRVKITPIKYPEQFISNFTNKKSNEVLVVLGSMYVLGKIKTGLLI